MFWKEARLIKTLHRLRVRPEAWSQDAVVDALSDARTCGYMTLEAARTFVFHAGERPAILAAVLAAPHPSYLAALDERFGGAAFRRGSGQTNSYPLDELDLDGLEPKQICAILRAIQAMAPDSCADYEKVCFARDLCQQRRNFDMLPDLIEALGFTPVRFLHLMGQVKPWKRGSPRLIAWCCDLFEQNIFRESPEEEVLLGSLQLLPNLHLFSLLLRSGADLRTRQEFKVPRIMPPAWEARFERALESRHGLLLVSACISDMTLRDILGASEDALLELYTTALAPKIAA